MLILLSAKAVDTVESFNTSSVKFSPASIIFVPLSLILFKATAFSSFILISGFEDKSL
jgi:hypothetical protein